MLGKKEGSLSIHNLFTLNKALVGRWNWRFAMERDLLWKQIIIEKFGEEEGERGGGVGGGGGGRGGRIKVGEGRLWSGGMKSY